MEVIKSAEQFSTAVSSTKLAVVHFVAEWAEQCRDVAEILSVYAGLPSVQSNQIKFYSVNAEELSDISLKNQIEAVPTILFFKNGKCLDRINGVHPEEINEKIKEHSGVEIDITSETIKSKEDLNSRLKKLINKHKVMIFMKGDRNGPRCGFSKQLIAILNQQGCAYETFDILLDEEVRQGLKTYSDWPTYPQVYVNGELIGGLDIIKELESSGELVSTLKGE